MTHIPTLICGCGHEMSREKNGVVLQGDSIQNGEQTPYYKISTDRFVCKNCLNAAYIPARVPLSYQHQEDFEKVKAEKIFLFAG